jgi:hypothetical protein
MAVEGILRVLHLIDVECAPIFLCTRSLLFGCQYLLAGQSFFSGKIGLPDGSEAASSSVSVDLPENYDHKSGWIHQSIALTIILLG